jgi:hypothetical protein
LLKISFLEEEDLEIEEDPDFEDYDAEGKF